eukprot:3461058-Prorocentrum_lima.AAC.1
MQPCSGDQNLEPWFNRWLDIYHSMDTEPSGDLKRSILEMFVDQLQGCGAMKNVIMYFDSVDE